MLLLALLIILAGYLVGSFPSGYLAARIAGRDIRKEGSGNIGATNVLRVLGKRYGYPVFFLDTFKGFMAARVTLFAVSRMPVARDYAELYACLAATACIIGHSFPIWLKFKGGKGVATSAGAFLGLVPLAAIPAFIIWIVVFETTRYVSVASVIASISVPVMIAILVRMKMTQGAVFLYFASALALLVVWRHRANFSRLLKGTEQRFDRK